MSLLMAARELERRTQGKTWPQMLGNICGRVRSRVTIAVNTAYYRAKYRHVTFGRSVTVNGRLVITGAGKVIIGDGCIFDTAGGKPNKIMTFASDARIVIGDHCFLNSIEIACRDTVEIGRRSMIGECLLMDTDFHSIEINRWDPQAVVKTKPIQIKENVWIANRTVVLKGVTIGANSVVGAGTVVRQSVPTNVVIAGNPQQIVKELDTSIAPYEPVA